MFAAEQANKGLQNSLGPHYNLHITFLGKKLPPGNRGQRNDELFKFSLFFLCMCVYKF